MADEAQLEILNDAHQALLRFGDFMTCADPRGYVRQSNMLLDACLDAGMSHDEPDHIAWAGERVTAWLLSGPACYYCDTRPATRLEAVFGNYTRLCEQHAFGRAA